MNVIKSLGLACVLAAIPAGLVVAQEYYTPRQYYGGWKKAPAGYIYRDYYYKPTPSYAGYQRDYVIKYPDKEYYYYYSPKTKKYWGRCPTTAAGKPVYSLLPEKERKAKLADIPESAFPAPGPLPPIPGSNDGAKLDLPPEDLPPDAALPE
jgi:hypothetical protein